MRWLPPCIEAPPLDFLARLYWSRILPLPPLEGRRLKAGRPIHLRRQRRPAGERTRSPRPLAGLNDGDARLHANAPHTRTNQISTECCCFYCHRYLVSGDTSRSTRTRDEAMRNRGSLEHTQRPSPSFFLYFFTDFHVPATDIPVFLSTDYRLLHGQLTTT